MNKTYEVELRKTVFIIAVSERDALNLASLNGDQWRPVRARRVQ